MLAWLLPRRPAVSVHSPLGVSPAENGQPVVPALSSAVRKDRPGLAGHGGDRREGGAADPLLIFDGLQSTTQSRAVTPWYRGA